MSSIEYIKCTTGVYIREDVPGGVFINPTEILAEMGITNDENLRMACFHQLAEEYKQEGFAAVLIDDKGENNASSNE